MASLSEIEIVRDELGQYVYPRDVPSFLRYCLFNSVKPINISIRCFTYARVPGILRGACQFLMVPKNDNVMLCILAGGKLILIAAENEKRAVGKWNKNTQLPVDK